MQAAGTGGEKRHKRVFIIRLQVIVTPESFVEIHSAVWPPTDD